MKSLKIFIHSKHASREIRIQSKEKNKKFIQKSQNNPENRNIQKSQYTQKSRNIHKIHRKTLYTHIYTEVGTRIYTQSGTRIYPSIRDAYIHVNLGRVYTPQFGTRIHTYCTDCTLINSSFGTRIGTSIWDAKLGRVYGCQFGTRIWDAYT